MQKGIFGGSSQPGLRFHFRQFDRTEIGYFVKSETQPILRSKLSASEDWKFEVQHHLKINYDNLKYFSGIFCLELE